LAIAAPSDVGGAGGESAVTGERYLELKIIFPDGLESENGVQLKAQWLSNLAGLFRRLPDNHYAIYLVQAETKVRRLVIEVYVRNGKVIDPTDDSEGARDRPPTDETAKAPAEVKPAQAAEPKVNDQPAGDANPAAPAESNDDPFDPTSSIDLRQPVLGSGDEQIAYRPTTAALRHGPALAGAALALAASSQSWQWQVEEALTHARPSHWRRLRMAAYWRRRRPR
jgi:hypothetical protein